jgi:leader peptidase (prepilin peptidase)/N-methyltransferase
MAALDALPFGMGVGLAALAGLLLGSFLATLVLRWPLGRSVLRGRSLCDACGTALTARDLIPLLSAIAARGRCRHCGAPIGALHWRALMPGTAGWLWALFGWLLLPLALLDARHMWLPDPLNVVLALAGLLLAGPLLEVSLLDRWIGAVAGGLVLAAIAAAYRRVRASEGMGGGDPKLVAAIGCWIGWQALPLLLLLASLGGLVWAFGAQRKGDGPLSMRAVPFGVFACTAAWATVPLWPLISGR